MALIDVRCVHDHISEVYRAAENWPHTPQCPECGEPTEQIHLPKSAKWTVDPVVVFKAPDGSFRFPGDDKGLMASTYEKQGFSRIEIRGAAEMRRFEGQMNQRERSEMARRVERRQELREQREKEMRSELRREMRQMSEFGKDLAREAMRRNDQKPRERAGDANFVSECYSFDRSNRDESRNSQGKRYRD